MKIRTALPLLLALSAGGHAADTDDFSAKIVQLEQEKQARIGVAVTDQAGRTVLGHRENERFALCSTFKLPLVAQVLWRIDQGREKSSRPLAYNIDALQEYAPVARRYAPSGYMTVQEASLAALQWSDNTAANLLLDTLGGPAGFTRFVRQNGDSATRLDRPEPDLNSNQPDDPRDTTTPLAMSRLTSRLLWGNTLRPATRQQLQRWLIGNSTGDTTIRAGLPAGWLAGEKTGSCELGGRNDAGFVRSPAGKNHALAIYTLAPQLEPKERDALIAETARLVTAQLEPQK